MAKKQKAIMARKGEREQPSRTAKTFKDADSDAVYPVYAEKSDDDDDSDADSTGLPSESRRKNKETKRPGVWFVDKLLLKTGMRHIISSSGETLGMPHRLDFPSAPFPTKEHLEMLKSGDATEVIGPGHVTLWSTGETTNIMEDWSDDEGRQDYATTVTEDFKALLVITGAAYDIDTLSQEFDYYCCQCRREARMLGKDACKAAS